MGNFQRVTWWQTPSMDGFGPWEWLIRPSYDLFSTPEKVNSYSFTQVIENSLIPIDPKWSQPMGVRLGGRLWIVEPTTGDLGVIDLPVDDGPWTEITLDHEVYQLTTDGQSLFLLGPETLEILTPANGSELTPKTPISVEHVIDLPTKLLNGQATDMVAYNGEAWVAWGDALIHLSEDGVSVHPLPEGGSICTCLDRVTGGNAEDLEMLYLVGETNGEGWLRSTTLNGGWLTPSRSSTGLWTWGIRLNPTISMLSMAPVPLDATETGPIIVKMKPTHRWCRSSTIPQPGSTHIHRASSKLISSPIIESPKDAAIGTDYTSEGCVPPMTNRSRSFGLGMLRIGSSIEQRLLPNVAYFEP